MRKRLQVSIASCIAAAMVAGLFIHISAYASPEDLEIIEKEASASHNDAEALKEDHGFIPGWIHMPEVREAVIVISDNGFDTTDDEDRNPDSPGGVSGNSITDPDSGKGSGDDWNMDPDMEDENDEADEEEDNDDDTENGLKPTRETLTLFRKGRTQVSVNGATRYVSSDKRVVTVSSKGVVKARNAGECEIRAYKRNICRDIENSDREGRWELIDTVPVEVYSLSMVKSVSAESGEKFNANEWMLGENSGGDIITEPSDMTPPDGWHSSNPSCAAVDNDGTVSLIKPGSAFIYPYYSFGKPDVFVRIRVKKESEKGTDPIFSF